MRCSRGMFATAFFLIFGSQCLAQDIQSTADCTIELDGKILNDGRCYVEAWKDDLSEYAIYDDFVVDGAGHETFRDFFMVTIPNDAAEIYIAYNDGEGADHAHNFIGYFIHDEFGCFKNERAKICLTHDEGFD